MLAKDILIALLSERFTASVSETEVLCFDKR